MILSTVVIMFQTMTEKKEHFMEKHKGPAKQFLALIGDDNGTVSAEFRASFCTTYSQVKSEFDGLNQSVKVEKDCYYIDN